jgi:ankyrin repeat protein
LTKLGAQVSNLSYGPSDCDTSPIGFAARQGKIDNVLTLAELGGMTAQKYVLHWVAMLGTPDMVSDVCQAYPGYLNTQDSKGWTPLHYAAMDNSADMIKQLVQMGASLDIRDLEGDSPLHLAISTSSQEGGLDRIRALLGLGANIEAVNSKGYTPLLLSVQTMEEEAIHELFESGASLHVKDQLGRNALHIHVIYAGPSSISTFLVQNGVALDAFDHHGLTPMHYALMWDKTFETLLTLGGQVDTLDAYGRTPLHLTGLLPIQNVWNQEGLCLFEESSKMARNLLRFGADPSIRDGSGKTPADLARDLGQVEIARIIEDGI